MSDDEKFNTYNEEYVKMILSIRWIIGINYKEYSQGVEQKEEECLKL